MTDKVLIGYICEKGNHPALIGEDDYGVCGSRAKRDSGISQPGCYGS